MTALHTPSSPLFKTSVHPNPIPVVIPRTTPHPNGRTVGSAATEVSLFSLSVESVMLLRQFPKIRVGTFTFLAASSAVVQASKYNTLIITS